MPGIVHNDLVHANQLQANLEDWAIVDTRFYLPEPDRGADEYVEAHIPGAVYAHLDRDLSGPLTGTNGRHPMPSVEQMVDRFSKWGIGDDVQVVVYDNAGGQIASRLWWMLRYLVHDAVAVLDGGLPAFGGELRGGREERTPRSFTPRVQDAMRIDIDAVAQHHREHLLIDARAGERFRGEKETLDPVAGHIPGAKNLPCASNLNAEDRFLSPKELRARFEAVVGAKDVTDVVSYCGSGITACHNLLAMEVAGIRGARLYPGSWSEWCADKSRTVETG
ncbi:MAG: sulfurtransferase [Acidobacteriota bacterium]|nr:MAG: sulfurtransferase [Acidobacteriota bacterium]